MDTADREAADRIAARRWPDGIRCAHCNSSHVTARNRPERHWPQWRCRDCRKEFTAATNTHLHGTRSKPSAILRSQHDEAEALRRANGPLRDASRSMLAVVDALRRRPRGATLRRLATMGEISTRHARRCLAELARRDIAEKVRDVTAYGHGAVAVSLWRLTYSETCIEALGDMPRMSHLSPTPASDDDALPARFWSLFWSGTPGPDLRLRDHGVHIGGTLIGGRDIGAECWALRHLSTEDLKTLRGMRGYDTGDTALAIDGETKRRSRAAA